MSRAIGIDLGTTNCVAAYVADTGKVELIPDENKSTLVPSVVFFEDDGNPVIGRDAMGMVAGYADRTVRWIKRQMGDPQWRFRLPEGTSYSAIDLSAILLRQLRRYAESHLDCEIHEAVITVPAYFDELRRAATMSAAAQAGLNVVRLINEPTAAALAYAHSRGDAGNRQSDGRESRILVFDFGGGTFDVSVVDVHSRDHVVVQASDGVHRLGGYDLDAELAKYYCRCIELEEQVHIQPGSPEWLAVVTDAERDKCQLSKMKKVRGRVQLGTRLLNVEIDQEGYWDLVRPYITQTKMEIDLVLQEAGMHANEIDDVILVGGSTRSPLVRSMLTQYFGKEPITSLNDVEAVAVGAALEASRDTPTVSDVASHSYGTIVVDKSKKGRRTNVVMIEKNTPIPAIGQRTFVTSKENQERINCRVTQGEGSDPRAVLEIKSERMQLTPGLPKGAPVDVSFSYDINMRMRCIFTERATGITKQIELDALSAFGGTEGEFDASLPDELDARGFEELRLG